MTAIALSFPAMLIGVRDDYFSHFWCVRNRSRLAAGIDVEMLPLYLHATADALSQKIPICLIFIPYTTYYSTIHPRTDPASSISFIVNLTFVFV